jgi:hypothetical protein
MHPQPPFKSPVDYRAIFHVSCRHPEPPFTSPPDIRSLLSSLLETSTASF